MRGDTSLAEILAAEERLRQDPHYVVDRAVVLRWMREENLEAQGALCSLLFNGSLSRRIEPHLTPEQYLTFLLPYYERCLREDPLSDWADDRWSAGRDLVSWIRTFWNDERTRPAVDQIRDWLGRLYKSAQADLRTVLVQATLEHVFESEDVADRFVGWRNDPDLGQAYLEARLWKEGLDELASLPRQSASSAGAQAEALEKEVAARLPPGSTKDAVVGFLGSHGFDYFEISKHNLVTASARPVGDGLVGGVHMVFWFDADGRLMRHRIGAHLESFLPGMEGSGEDLPQ